MWQTLFTLLQENTRLLRTGRRQLRTKGIDQESMLQACSPNYLSILRLLHK